MIQSRAAFLESFIGRIEPRIVLLREMPDKRSWNIAGALERIVAADRAELEILREAAAAASTAEAPIAVDPAKVTWKHPVFNVGGRFNPFAGTYAQQMLASADVCDRLGHPEIGDGYRAIAATGCRPGLPDPQPESANCQPATPKRQPRRPRSTWSGPNMPPPEPTPFVAGEQIGFAL